MCLIYSGLKYYPVLFSISLLYSVSVYIVLDLFKNLSLYLSLFVSLLYCIYLWNFFSNFCANLIEQFKSSLVLTEYNEHNTDQRQLLHL